MSQLVTQEIRTAVIDALLKASSLIRPYELESLSDPLALAIHNELTREGTSGSMDIAREVSDLIIEGCEEKAISEYIALKKCFSPDRSAVSNITLIRGLHRHERNREWMDLNDPLSVKRNTALLQATLLIRQNHQALVREVFEYNREIEHRHTNGIRDAECVGLILDHPEQYETLVHLIIERGYRDGVEAFRVAAVSNTPALSNGVL